MIYATAAIDTNFCSVLQYSGGSSIVRIQQMKTREWWTHERGYYRLYSSQPTENELSQGSFPGQRNAIAFSRRFPYLADNELVRKYTQLYLKAKLVPESKPGDALQLALATAYRIDYLLTWDYAHLANVHTQNRLYTINAANGWRTPLVVSPETIPWASLGQQIRRKDD